MRIELSVASGDTCVDVAIEAPEQCSFGAVLPQLACAVGADSSTPIWHGDALLAPATPLGSASLRVGSVLSFGRRAGSGGRPAVLSLHVVGGPGAGSIVALERGRFTIGRAPDCDIALPDPDVSRRHARLDVTPTGITLTDLGSTNGTTVDGRPVSAGGVVVPVGCLIALGDSLLTIAGPLDTPATVQHGDDGHVLVLRPPRHARARAAADITLPTRTSAGRPRGVQWISALLPAAGGAALAWFAHAPQFLLFALLSPLMMVSSALGERVHWRRSRGRDAATFWRRCAEVQQQITTGLAAEADALRHASPDPAALLRQVTLPGSRVWERRGADADLLRLRLGTAELESALMVRDGSAVTPAGTLSAVPLCIDLRRGPLGIAGPPDVCAALARWLAGQVSALHSPADVELALLLSADRSASWRWARWLPQLRGRVATCDGEWGELVAELDAIVEQRFAQRRLDPDGWRGPWLVLVVDRAGALTDVPGLGGLLARGASVGVTAICIDTDATALPAGCVAVAAVSGVTGTRVALRQADGAEIIAVIDQVSRPWADALARALAPLVDASAPESSTIPAHCSLLGELDLPVLDTVAISRRWQASDGGARTALGRTAEGRLDIDLAVDGPHALVAGTTGSGKSELLQSLVAGLAASHPPDELNFLLIDYKGGAAFADCARLPHTAGLVTDLDTYLTERALRALDSELRRRERLFAAAGSSDLAGYRACHAPEPVPRLIIVVDEFAALAEELPDFVRGLVGVAQRGRSLGVHLVLATQRPAGAVSAEIRANTSLRIALRVTDPGESTDVVDSPVAAAIERATPGRAYLRAGATLTCFQTARVSGTSDTDQGRVDVELLGPWRRAAVRVGTAASTTDLTRLVDALVVAAGGSGRRVARSPWLAPLPEALPRAALAEPAAPTSIPLGWIDLPDEQRRDTLQLDLTGAASLLIAGGPRSGRTAALISLAVGAAEQLDPTGLHLHVLDATGAFAAEVRRLPHCATVLGPEELALAPRLLHRLVREAAVRVAAPSGGHARLLLLVDGWDALCAGLSDLDAMRCSEELAGLLRIGAAAGIAVAVAGDRSVLAPRFAGGFAERLVLRLSDRGDYALAGIGAREVPGALPAGRGVRVADHTVVQLAHAGTRPGPAGARAVVAAVAERWAGRGPGSDAIVIRQLPGRVELEQVPTPAGHLALGLVGDRLDPLALDPFAGAARLLVAGPPRSGRTTVLRLLARQAHAAGIRTLVAATSRSPLAADARQLAIPLIGPGASDVGDVPADPTLLLVDDSEAFTESAAGDRLATWARIAEAPLAVIVAGRSDEVATTYRGLAAEVRRSQCGILLRPGPVDGELLGVRLPREASAGPPGRGVAVGDPSWGALFEDGEPVPIQVAAP